MFDPIGAFEKQFTQVEGGFLFYPSRKSGGKLVTDEEYNLLVSDWKRASQRVTGWKTVGAVVVAAVLWTSLSEALYLPDWTTKLLIIALVIAMCAWLFWASFAPRRLVTKRSAVAPPRPASEARRAARAALNWPFVIFALLLSGATFWSTVNASDRTLSTWLWLLGSGLMLGTYLWIGLGKLLDFRR
jgi:hypothetical protein